MANIFWIAPLPSPLADAAASVTELNLSPNSPLTRFVPRVISSFAAGPPLNIFVMLAPRSVPMLGLFMAFMRLVAPAGVDPCCITAPSSDGNTVPMAALVMPSGAPRNLLAWVAKSPPTELIIISRMLVLMLFTPCWCWGGRAYCLAAVVAVLLAFGRSRIFSLPAHTEFLRDRQSRSTRATRSRWSYRTRSFRNDANRTCQCGSRRQDSLRGSEPEGLECQPDGPIIHKALPTPRTEADSGSELKHGLPRG